MMPMTSSHDDTAPSAIGLQRHKRSATRYRPRLPDHADRRPGVPRQAPPARPAEPGPALWRQDGVLRRRRIDTPVQAHSGPGQDADPAEAQRLRLLRPDPRRRPEDDRRDRQRIRRGDPAARRPRRRRRGRLPGRPDRQGRRTRHHRDQHPRGLRRHRRAPRRPSPTPWLPRRWPTATWAWRCRSWRPAVSPPR